MTFDPIFIIMLCVLGAGLCGGWIARELLAPPIKDRRGDLPFVQHRHPRTVEEALHEQSPAYEKPAAPAAPRFEEDPFFAKGQGGLDADDVEHLTGARVLARSYGAR